MGTCTSLNVDQQAVVTTWTNKKLDKGPINFKYYPPWHKVKVYPQVELKINQYAVVENSLEPDKSKIILGPTLYVLQSPYESVSKPLQCDVLDQNDYIIVTTREGVKRTVKGPTVFKPVFGETWEPKKDAVMVNINKYLIVKDNASSQAPVTHIPGPIKYYPNPYDVIEGIKDMIEITNTKAVWIFSPEDGQAHMIDFPQMYMPKVGEYIIKTIDKTILQEHEFCIVISPDGKNMLKSGNKTDEKAFFLPPYHKFMDFKLGDNNIVNVLSILPQYLSNSFTIRTSDNVIIKLDLRVSYRVIETVSFSIKPINFFDHIRYWTQNELLDHYAKVDFKTFVKTYTSVAQEAIQNSHNFFNEYGICIIDIQIINYKCEDPKTQSLLDTDIITYITKQNELKAKQTDIEIMKKENEIIKEKKDLEFLTAEKDNEIMLKKKDLEMNTRIKELESQIEEEKKRVELFEIKKANAVKEGEFEGKAQGASIAAFYSVIPDNVSVEDKKQMWMTLRELEKAQMLYSKVSTIEMFPPGSDIKHYNFNVSKELENKMDNPMVLPLITSYSGDTGRKNGVK